MFAHAIQRRNRSQNTMSISLAVAAGMLLIPSARADHLLGVGTEPSVVSPVTEADQPTLKGTVVEDKMVPVDATSAFNGHYFGEG